MNTEQTSENIFTYTVTLFLAVNIYYYLIKYQTKHLLSFRNIKN